MPVHVFLNLLSGCTINAGRASTVVTPACPFVSRISCVLRCTNDMMRFVPRRWWLGVSSSIVREASSAGAVVAGADVDAADGEPNEKRQKPVESKAAEKRRAEKKKALKRL